MIEATMKRRRFGWVNGKDVYSRDEYVFESRGFGEITSDRVLMKFAKEVTSNWYDAGHHHTFEGFFLGDYCLSEPCKSLTHKEFARLKELQKEAREKQQRIEDEKEWKYDHTEYFADNSEEEVWINKYGESKRIMTVHPHGDASY